ncbi:cyclic nucleotide-binding domain-containing protein [Paenibacillus konkukensis]|uniref:cyclic nucleotide-binding domain-containing protein n=1 Tax=Paenibacillus konkukensis TaxID=2020716 RepID=UPI00201D6A85|nr:cyclic nucleotide-binding domain-containing protein [Paenibacillus konkukensis]
MNKLAFLEIPLFVGLDRAHKAALLQQFTQLSYRAGDILFEEGEFGDSLYIIMQGKTRIYLGSGNNETTLAILGEKEYFGEMALLTGDPRSASARAESDLVVLKLIKDSFDRILYEHNTLAVQFAGILAKRLAKVNRESSRTAGPPPEEPALPEPEAVEEASTAEAAAAVRPNDRRAAAGAAARSRLPVALCMAASFMAGALLCYGLQADGASTAANLWQWAAVGPDSSPPSSLSATIADGAAVEVPVAVYLPKDASAAVSMQRGVELAMADLQASSAYPRFRLSPDYRGDGGTEELSDGSAAPAFAIAASLPAGQASASVPTLLLDGAAASAAGRSVALGIAPGVYAGEVAEWLARQSFGKVAIYYEDSAAGRQFAAALEKAADRKGILVADRLTRISARSALTAVIGKWKLLETEAVVVYDSSGEAAPEIGSGLQAAGARYPLLAGPAVPAAEMMPAYAGEVYGYTDFAADAAAGGAAAAAFADKYRAAYGMAPSRIAAAAYDAVRLIALSADKAGSAEPARMVEALKAAGVWEGALRTYNFNAGSETGSGSLVRLLKLSPKQGEWGE